MATEKRLIEAKYLTSQMYLICEACQTENIFIDAIIDEIDNAPDVDAVEVVYCQDCARCDRGYCTIRRDSWGARLKVGLHDYCSDAERRKPDA